MTVISGEEGRGERKRRSRRGRRRSKKGRRKKKQKRKKEKKKKRLDTYVAERQNNLGLSVELLKLLLALEVVWW